MVILSMGTNNIDELLDQVIGRFVDNYSCEDFDSISSMAEQGHARAQYSLGSCYHFAQGVEEDQSRAVEWYRKAAEQGYIDAQYNLGFCYQFSYGMEQDLSQAVVWYKKAAEQGHASAQAYLGLLYENGIGVAEDIKEAVVWYKNLLNKDILMLSVIWVTAIFVVMVLRKMKSLRLSGIRNQPNRVILMHKIIWASVTNMVMVLEVIVRRQ